VFRAILSLYLIVVTIFGPGLCCCAFGQCSVGKKSESIKAEEAQSPACCCQHSKHQDNEPSAPCNHQPTRSCPCKQHQETPVAFSLSTPIIILTHSTQELQNSFDGFAFASITSLFSTLALNCHEMLHLVQLSAQDTLRAPHVLRC
jgi:hypothetical protein